MLDSLFVRNFRIFKELKIERLGRVNLFAGKNNSGKSCLLEAIHIYVSNASPTVLFELISHRSESWETDIQPRDEQNLQEQESSLRHLFCGYHLPKIGSDGIEIGLVRSSESRLRIRTQAYQMILTSEGGRKLIPLKDIQDELLEGTDSNLVGVGIVLEIENKGKSSLFPLTEESRRRGYRSPSFRSYFPEIKENIQTVPAGSMSELQVSLLWDKINLTDLQDEVVECLKLIDGNVKGVSLVGGEERYIRHYREQ